MDNATGNVIAESIILLSCYCVSLDYNFVPVGEFSACRGHVAPGIQSVFVSTRDTLIYNSS